MLLEVSLIGIEHAIEPRQELLGAVIGVKDNGNAVDGGERSDEVSSGNGTGNRGSLVAVGDTLERNVRISDVLLGSQVQELAGSYLAGEEGSTALGELQDDGGLGIASSLESSNDGGGRSDVLTLSRISFSHVHCRKLFCSVQV